ncbi:hypothetical protein [Nisaea sp.]|uniref:hypothetical protein n=1 Tax=Nisaea sp. TaxID=2024842 RepID=UPI002B27642F|nr:hypothetical protein [Nisaea sp.]
MTATIVPFIPKNNRPDGSPSTLQQAYLQAARRNMADFIAHQQQHSPFMAMLGIDWDASKWVFDSVRGSTSKTSCNFATKPHSKEPFPYPFLDQAKAIVAELYRKSSNSEPSKIVRALRTIYAALIHTGKQPDLTLVDQTVIDQLSEYIERGGRGGWWQQGQHLGTVINSVLKYHSLTEFDVSFNNPYRYKDSISRENLLVSEKQSEQFKDEKTRKDKLPDLNAILDIASLFNRHGGLLHHYNTIYSCFVALGMFAPSRQAEITTLPIDCVTASADETHAPPRMGLRWRPAKGGLAITKFAVGSGANPEWESVATEAVYRLKIMGRSARQAAKWYSENPSQLYLPSGTEHLRGQALTWPEIAGILDWDPVDKPNFRTAFRMSKALEKVGETNAPRRMGELKKVIREVGHAWTYTYQSVLDLAKQRVFAKNIRQGPNNARMRAWFEAHPNQLELPEDLAHLHGQPITRDEVIRLLNAYSDYAPMRHFSQRYTKALVRSGTTTDPERVRRKEYDQAAQSNETRATYSQNSIREYILGHIAEYPGPLPANLQLLADWFVSSPDKLYLPERLKHLDDQPLTLAEAFSIIGLTEKDLTKPKSIRYITTDELKAIGQTKAPDRGTFGKSYLITYSFESLETLVLRKLQDQFPIIDPETELPFSEALFCLGYNAQIADKATLWNVPFWVNYNSIITALSGQEKGNQEAKTIFSRNELLNSRTGKPWKLKTHQMRHLLNTLAQGKYLSQALIAFWSGRKSIGQNAAYDHLPQEAVIEAWQALDKKSGMTLNVTGPLAEKAQQRSINEVITYDEALKLELGSIHVTSKGLCRHNFALTPCPKDKDCDNCGESMPIAHDDRFVAETKKGIRLHRNALENSLKAQAEGEPGIERWISKHERKLRRLQLKLELMTDPDTPPGTIISMPPPERDQTRSGLVMDEVSANTTQDFGLRSDQGASPVQLELDAMFDDS